jgi:hypothetical protein
LGVVVKTKLLLRFLFSTHGDAKKNLVQIVLPKANLEANMQWKVANTLFTTTSNAKFNNFMLSFIGLSYFKNFMDNNKKG